MLKVKIKDFESISNLALDIKGFTVVVGRNNLGKSAIVRAIDAALTNRPGNDFIRWGKIKTEVNLQRDDLAVDWEKGEKTLYKVNGKPFSGLNRSVPPPILNAGFRQMEVGDDKCNPLVAHQFEEIFLLDKSGPVVTEVLSKIYNINIINDADALCQKSLRSTKSLLKTRESDLTELSSHLEKFKGFEQLKEKHENLKKCLSIKEKLEKELNEIKQYTIDYKNQNCLVNGLSSIKRVKIIPTKKEELSVSEFQWLKGACARFKACAENLQKLKPIKSLTLPEVSSTEKSIINYQWIVNICNEFHSSLKTVQILKPVTNVFFPDISQVFGMISSIEILNSLTNKFKATSNSFVQCQKVSIKFQNLVSLLGSFNKTKELLDGFSSFKSLQENFLEGARSLKILQKDVQIMSEDWLRADAEFKQFKTCPLCKKAL
jgi:AAA domain